MLAAVAQRRATRNEDEVLPNAVPRVLQQEIGSTELHSDSACRPRVPVSPPFAPRFAASPSGCAGLRRGRARAAHGGRDLRR